MKIYGRLIQWGDRLDPLPAKYIQSRVESLATAARRELGPGWVVRLKRSHQSEACYLHISNQNLRLRFIISVRNHGNFGRSEWDAVICLSYFKGFWELRAFFLDVVLPRCTGLGFADYRFNNEVQLWKARREVAASRH